jgi:uncharacterized membrane protein YoaK (UPF0700 family)
MFTLGTHQRSIYVQLAHVQQGLAVQLARGRFARIAAIVTAVEVCQGAAGALSTGPRRRHALVLALTVASGATDVIGFLALGQAFTSVMTGNLVLLGISLAENDGTLARHIVTAIVCFIAGCVFGGRLAGVAVPGQPLWPRAVTRALLVESVFFLAFAVAWWLNAAAPTGAVQLALLAVNAVALGIQSSAVQRLGVSGLSTTYMTGTLTTLVVRLASGGRLRHVRDSMQILASLIVGAVLAALLVEHAPMLAPLLQIVPVAVVVCCSAVMIRAERQPARSSEEPNGDRRSSLPT